LFFFEQRVSLPPRPGEGRIGLNPDQGKQRMTTLFLDNEVTGTFTAPSDSQEFTIANKKDFGDKRLDLVGTFSAAGTFDGGTLVLQGYDGATWNDIATLTAAGGVRVGPTSALNYRALMSGGTAPSVTWRVNSELWFEGSGSPTPPTNTNTWDTAKAAPTVVLSNGDLTVTLPNPTSQTPIAGVMAVQGASSGKYYWEVTCDSQYIGVGAAYTDWVSYLTGGNSFDNSNLFSYYSFLGTLKHSDASYGATYDTSDIIGVALDLDNHKIWFSKNGVWQASGDPATGTNPAYSTMPPNSGLYYPACALESADTHVAQAMANFGASAFAYPVPSGFTPGAP
jgi:SPRY domain